MDKLEVIRKIKKYKEPPYRKDDSYFLRSPWYKFGTMSSIREKWYWFTDETILQLATVKDIIEAYNEKYQVLKDITENKIIIITIIEVLLNFFFIE